MCIAVIIQMAISSRGLFHTRFTTACSLLDSELSASGVCVVARVFKGYTDAILLVVCSRELSLSSSWHLGGGRNRNKAK